MLILTRKTGDYTDVGEELRVTVKDIHVDDGVVLEFYDLFKHEVVNVYHLKNTGDDARFGPLTVTWLGFNQWNGQPVHSTVRLGFDAPLHMNIARDNIKNSRSANRRDAA